MKIVNKFAGLATLNLLFSVEAKIYTILAEKAILPTSYESQPATIQVDDQSGKILDVFGGIRNDKEVGDVVKVDEKDIILPGLVDSHVHINDPGREEWEGFDTATQAALSGGVTALIDMPLNSIPPTTTIEGLDAKKDATVGRIHSDIGFWAGSVPGNEEHLEALLEQEGVFGFKSFMIDSGVDEFSSVSPEDIKMAFKELTDVAKRGKNVTMLFHAEKETKKIDEKIEKNIEGKSTQEYSTYLLTHPEEYELEAISTLIEIMKEYPDIHVHIVHLSTAKALPMIRQARADGMKLTVETCFHYLYFNSEEIPSARVEYKAAPPVRDSANNQLLWKAIKDGDIDLITSDHSPADAETKKIDKGDFLDGWGGIASLGLGFQALYTKIQKGGGLDFSIGQLVELTSRNPAILAGFDDRKGSIKKGLDADFTIFSPDEKYVVKNEDIHYKHQISPYLGDEFIGRITQTYLRGVKVFDYSNNGLLEAEQATGKIM
ncbi:Metallo-dependent hydrolase [Wallemia mellicola]|nr:Metallo-dependent hydrolase [Wallemia mellicola]TIC07220.1 Metallo-dependent hydrolase [Wallemia mellicola]TIC48441.1 Metallo-dependent hydrolase [Wallemia mellicola]